MRCVAAASDAGPASLAAQSAGEPVGAQADSAAWLAAHAARQAALGARRGELIKLLSDFCSEFYPPVVVPGARARGAGDSGARRHNLRKVLEQLLNEWLNYSDGVSDNPYIRHQGKVWPPYTELLLRAGVAEQHDEDKRYIKLIDFC